MVLKAIGVLLSYAFTLYITNTLGAKAFGQYSLFFAVVNILSIVALFGTDRSVIRLYNDKNAEDGNKNVSHAMFAVLVSAFIFSLLLYLSWDWISNTFFSSTPAISTIRNFTVVLFFYSLYIFIAESLRAKNKMFLYGLLRFDMVFLLALILLFYFSNKEHEWPHIASFFYAVIITAIIAIIFYLKEYRLKLKWEPKVIQKVLNISYPMLLASSVGLIVGWIDTFMLGYFTDERAVGIYNIAFKVAFISSFLLTTINTVISPRIAKLSAEQNKEELRKLVRKVSKILFIGASLIFLGTILNMDLILSLFGQEFTQGTLALALLLVGQFISSYSGPVAILLQMTGHEKIFMYISIAAMLINVVLNLILIPKYGYVGAAAASAFTLIFNNLCCVYYVKKELNMYSIFIPFKKND